MLLFQDASSDLNQNWSEEPLTQDSSGFFTVWGQSSRRGHLVKFDFTCGFAPQFHEKNSILSQYLILKYKYIRYNLLKTNSVIQ